MLAEYTRQHVLLCLVPVFFIAGAIAVCSCTVLPLFKGNYKKGAGIGPGDGGAPWDKRRRTGPAGSGQPGHMALIPECWIASLVGGNSLLSNFIASFAGALTYFATLTEVPIMQGLIGSGMGQGPAPALLLAGPSLSLPSILVISGELGWKKTATCVGLVVVLSTAAGLMYGTAAG